MPSVDWADQPPEEPGYTPPDWQRWAPESPKSPERTAFERDRARVVHSSALRRLSAKTQVVAPDGNDFVRNRLTHSLEVAQVGRELGKALGCDPDVVDTACLAHDLGHPPFGHNGEAALAEAAAGIGGFEGNAQTLRLLTRLEPKVVDPVAGRSVGLNLTRASLDATAKYPWAKGEGPAASPSKFGVYDCDVDVFRWLRDEAPPGRRCMEAQLMDLADDIAYSVHDVEDAVVAGHLDLGVLGEDGQRARVAALVRDWYHPHATDDDLGAAMDALVAQPFWLREFTGTRADLAALKDMTSQLIGMFCEAAVGATRETYGDGPLTRYTAQLVLPGETEAQIAVLKGLAAVYVMAPREDEVLYRRQRVIVTDLVDVLRQRAPLGLEPHFAADWREASDDDARLRVIVDQVASLTDSSAMGWHAALVEPRS